MLRDIYLGHGWLSVLAWIGTAVIGGILAMFVVAALGMRTPHISRRAGLLAWRRDRNERILREREARQ